MLMLSNYFHDLSVAILASNIIVIYLLGRFFDSHPQSDEIVARIFRKMSRITYVALIYVLLGGAVRAIFFMDFEWNPAVGRGQVVALVVKHILLFALAAFGLLVHFKYVRRYGKEK